MIWTTDDNGYLISADLPERARCRACGAAYLRRVSEAKPWQAEAPDACPFCGHGHGAVPGLRFENVPDPSGGDPVPVAEYAERIGRTVDRDAYAEAIRVTVTGAEISSDGTVRKY